MMGNIHTGKTVFLPMRCFGLIVCFVLFSVCLTVSSNAQEALSWDDCVGEAFLSNPDLLSAQESVRQSQADKRIAQSGALPEITAQASGKESQTATRDDTAKAYAYSVTGKQLIFDGFKTAAGLHAAKQTLSAQEYNYAVVSSNVRLNLKNAFITLLRAQELISLTQKIAVRRKDNLKLVRSRYEAGREHKGALLTAQAEFVQAEFEAVRAQRSLSLAQQELSRHLGRGKKTEVIVRGSFDIEEGDAHRPDFEVLAETTPLLREFIAKREAARFDYASAKADFFPEVYLSSSFGKTQSRWPPHNEEWSAGIIVSFPLFEGGSRVAQASKAKSQWVQAQIDEQGGRDSVIVTLETTWKELQDAIDTVKVKAKFLEAAQARANIAAAQYSTGLITFDDWIIIENNLVDTQKAYLDSQADMAVAEAYWVQAKGGILSYVQK